MLICFVRLSSEHTMYVHVLTLLVLALRVLVIADFEHVGHSSGERLDEVHERAADRRVLIRQFVFHVADVQYPVDAVRERVREQKLERACVREPHVAEHRDARRPLFRCGLRSERERFAPRALNTHSVNCTVHEQ